MVFILRYASVPTAFLSRALTMSGTPAYNSSITATDIHNLARMHIIVSGEANDDWCEDLQRNCAEILAMTIEDMFLFKVPDLFPDTFLSSLLRRPEAHRYVAMSPNLTEEMLSILIEGQSTIVLDELARNPFIPVHIIELARAA